MTPPLTWGATVDEVSQLAPHITIKTDASQQLTADPVFGASQPRAVTVQHVQNFIEDVAARVNIRILRYPSIADAKIRETIERAAHDLTVQGAGAYLVSAAFPSKAGLNDNSSLSAELWNRFNTGLENLVTAVTEYLTPGDDGTGAYAAGANEGFFQAPLFPDVPQVGYYRDCPYPGAWPQ
jgi:hypothetical protein